MIMMSRNSKNYRSDENHNFTHSQSRSHNLPILCSSNFTLFETNTLPILNSSNLTLFQSYTLHYTLHSYNFTYWFYSHITHYHNVDQTTTTTTKTNKTTATTS